MSENQLQHVPDFFLVGAPKCATSSLHLLLLQHPDIFMCSPKEPHFFCTDFPGLAEVADCAAYSALFDAAPAGVRLGEASAFYLSSQDAAQNIYTANPAAKIILSIRNPVDAAFSLFHQLKDGFREDQSDFEVAWDLQEERTQGHHLPAYCPEPAQLQYRQVYRYHDQITRYFDVFGREQVKVLRFEDIRNTPDQVISELLEFIGIRPFNREITLAKTNTRRQPRFPGLTRFLSSPPPLLRPLMGPLKRGLNGLGIKPSVVMMKHLSRSSGPQTAQFAPGLRQRILAEFSAEIGQLEKLLDQDFSAWRV